MEFEDKTVLITGAASGMGRAQAIAFAAQGARVVGVDISADGLASLGEEIELIAKTVDLTDRDAVTTLVAEIVAETGRIDVLSNTAGIFDGNATSLEVSDETWNAVFATNLFANRQLTNAVLPHMIEQGGGSIVNIASVAGLLAGSGGAAYTAVKHALVGYTRELAYEYGKSGIKVNAVCPGIIRTPMNSAFLDDPEHPIQRILSQTAAGRYGTPDEIADLVMFLAGERSSFIHGQAIAIDGGFTLS